MSENPMYNFFGINPTERIPHRARRPADREKLFQYHEQMATALREKREESTRWANEGVVTSTQVASDLPPGEEVSAGMRKLLEAEDCAVRAALQVNEQK